VREEAQLLERAGQRRLLRVPLDIGIELRRVEEAADEIALQLRYVDAVR
jgi:hypothetical protein